MLPLGVARSHAIVWPMVSYEIVSEASPGLGNWAIRMVINGVAQEGTIGAGYEAKADAKYWVEQLSAQDKVKR